MGFRVVYRIHFLFLRKKKYVYCSKILRGSISYLETSKFTQHNWCADDAGYLFNHRALHRLNISICYILAHCKLYVRLILHGGYDMIWYDLIWIRYLGTTTKAGTQVFSFFISAVFTYRMSISLIFFRFLLWFICILDMWRFANCFRLCALFPFLLVLPARGNRERIHYSGLIESYISAWVLLPSDVGCMRPQCIHDNNNNRCLQGVTDVWQWGIYCRTIALTNAEQSAAQKRRLILRTTGKA